MASPVSCLAVILILLVISQTCLATNTSTISSPTTVQPRPSTVTEQPPLETIVSSRHQPSDVTNQGTVSRAQYELIELTFEFILKPIVCITGIVLNSVGIYVLLQPSLRHGFYIYLAALSMADVGYLLFGLLRASVKIYALYDNEAAVKIQAAVIVYTDRYLEICLCKLGAYCIMFFSLDRLMAIVRPLHVKGNFLSVHSRAVCISLALFIFTIYIPKVLNMEVAILTDPNTNLSAVVLKPVPREDGSTLKQIIHTYDMALDVIFTYLPPVFVIAVNIGIIVQIQRLRRMRKRTFSKGSAQTMKNIDQQKLIVTVVIISCFFLGVYIPMIIIRNLTINDPDYLPFHREHYLANVIPIFVAFGWSINAAIDFTVYLGTSAKFREAIKRTCFCCRATNAKQKFSTSQAGSQSGKSSWSGRTEDSWTHSGSELVNSATSAYSIDSVSAKTQLADRNAEGTDCN